MAYVGGKSKGASHILEILNDPIYNNMDYIEPFVGYEVRTIGQEYIGTASAGLRIWF